MSTGVDCVECEGGVWVCGGADCSGMGGDSEWEFTGTVPLKCKCQDCQCETWYNLYVREVNGTVNVLLEPVEPEALFVKALQQFARDGLFKPTFPDIERLKTPLPKRR